MKNEHQRPFMNPSPLPFDFLSNDAFTPFFSNLAISPCPFCHQGFELAWDCKTVFYRHAYHSWCAISHFSSSSKCLFKGCGEEMHIDWWVVATPLWPSVGVKPNTHKVEDLESPRDSECSEFNSRHQNTLHWGVLGVIGKVLKRKCRKWPRIGHLDICSPRYGQKKGRE